MYKQHDLGPKPVHQSGEPSKELLFRWQDMLYTLFEPHKYKVQVTFSPFYGDPNTIIISWDDDDRRSADFAQFVLDNLPKHFHMEAGQKNHVRLELSRLIDSPEQVLLLARQQLEQQQATLAHAADLLKQIWKITCGDELNENQLKQIQSLSYSFQHDVERGTFVPPALDMHIRMNRLVIVELPAIVRVLQSGENTTEYEGQAEEFAAAYRSADHLLNICKYPTEEKLTNAGV